MSDTTHKTPPTPIEDGGPAFAAQGADRYAFQTGMSLRDWFAGRAREEDIAEYMPPTLAAAATFEKAHGFRATREWAKFQYADAMIAAQFQRK